MIGYRPKKNKNTIGSIPREVPGGSGGHNNDLRHKTIRMPYIVHGSCVFYGHTCKFKFLKGEVIFI